MKVKCISKTLLMAGALSISSLAHAGGNANSSCEKMPQCCEKPNQCQGVSLCHAYPNIDSCGYHVDVGFLLEQMRVTGTQFGYSTSGTFNTLTQGAASIQKPNFDLDWGVTAGLGYYLPYDDWFLEARFDWLSSNGKGRQGSSGGKYTVPTGIWVQGIVGGVDMQYATTAKSNLSIQYYMFQVDLSRASWISDALAIEPYAGVKAAWIDYDDNVSYSGGNVPTAYVKRSMETKFWGVGPQLGLNTRFGMMEGISFVGESGAALLVGNSSATDKVVSGLLKTNARDSQAVISPVLRGLVGLQFDKNVYCDRQHIAIKLGFDVQCYFNQYNHIDVGSQPLAVSSNGISAHTFNSVENGTYSMVGLYADFAWEF